MPRLKTFIPACFHVWLVRILRWPRSARAWRNCARERGVTEDFPVLLAEHKTPLLRETTVTPDSKLQDGKVQNLRVASRKIDKIVIQPGETFSYHSLIGWPGRWRGFRPGLELRGDQLKAGIGGGSCALSNLLYLIAIRSGFETVERHRHGLNLFPDHGRTIPFGCGATVFFPYADLKFANSLPFPVLINLYIENETHLVGRVLGSEESGLRFLIEERDHRYEKRDEKWYRENRIVRIPVCSTTGEQRGDEIEIAVNKGLCLYDPEQAGEIPG